MERMSLEEIAGYTGGEFAGENRENVDISQVSIDSREIGENCLFIAIKGENTDGHRYLSGAVEGGAVAVMVHQLPQSPLPVPVLLVENTEKALLDLAAGYRKRFSIPFVAVTGSVGKTTTKDMTAAALGAKYQTLKTAGNQNNQFGMPKTLLRVDNKTEAAVIEMGMTGLHEIEALSLAARPDTAIITNIGVSHLEQLGTRENILRAKLEVLAGLKPGGALVLNGDNDLLSQVGEEVWPHILRCSLCDPQADFLAFSLREEGRGCRFQVKVRETGETVEVVLPFSGEHHVMDALLAMAAAFCHGVSPAQSSRALAHVRASGLRQKILLSQGVTVVADCYNANPDSMRASLSAFGKLPLAGKRIAVLGDMLELGSISRQSHRDVGGWCGQNGVKVLLCMGEESREMLETARQAGVEAWHFTVKEELVRQLWQVVEPGDGVLFKASHSMEFEKLIGKAFPDLEREL